MSENNPDEGSGRMKLSELIAKYGDEKVEIQKVDDCATHLDMDKRGTSARFVTTQRIDLDGFQKLGLIVWMDRAEVSRLLSPKPSSESTP